MFCLHKSSCFKFYGRMSGTFILIYISGLFHVVIDDVIANTSFSNRYNYIDYSSDTSWCARVKNMFSIFGFV